MMEKGLTDTECHELAEKMGSLCGIPMSYDVTKKCFLYYVGILYKWCDVTEVLEMLELAEEVTQHELLSITCYIAEIKTALTNRR